jgi:hypothetical protein
MRSEACIGEDIWKREGEAHQKILAELTGVGVNLNILTFRLFSLLQSERGPEIMPERKPQVMISITLLNTVKFALFLESRVK